MAHPDRRLADGVPLTINAHGELVSELGPELVGLWGPEVRDLARRADVLTARETQAAMEPAFATPISMPVAAPLYGAGMGGSGPVTITRHYTIQVDATGGNANEIADALEQRVRQFERESNDLEIELRGQGYS